MSAGGEAAVAARRPRDAAAAAGGFPGLMARARARARTTAFLLGTLTAAALPPVHALPLLALTFAGLLYLVLHGSRPRDALVAGWLFGFGYFLAGLYWVGIAFFVEAERFGALAVPAVIGLCAGSAAFPAVACWLVALRRWRSVAAAALALALAWTAAEVLRGVLTAFPWNPIGAVWPASSGVGQLAAVAGVYGLSLLTVAVAALPATLLEPGDGAAAGGRGRLVLPPLLGALALTLVWAGGQARLALADVEPTPGVRLRLVQANVPQDRKWDPEERERWFRRHLELSVPPEGERVTHVVWPESAVPYTLGRDPEARRLIGTVVPEGGYVLTGANRYDFDAEPLKVWNSLQVVNEGGRIVAHYDKVDLVPFGEFLPFRGVLGRLGLEGLAAGAVDFQRGPGRLTLDLPGLPPFSALICYEAIFAGGAVDHRARRPDWLLNVTNDGWFGTSSGPFQHLAMARLRAVEEGLPLVRAANTGVSAVVDPYGRLVARLGLNETGALDADLPRPLAPTPYARLGALGPLALAALAALLAAAAERRGRRHR